MTQIKIDKELRKILKTHSLIEFSDGLKYTGMTKKKGDQLIAHGLGFGMWPNGHSYKGQFKNGQFHGWGNYISPGNYEYSGLWKNNYMNGSGTIKHSNGHLYIGQFKNSTMHGIGKLTVPKIYTYEGSFKNGTFNGKGKTVYLKNFPHHEKGEIREGNFKDGKWHGNFKITYPDGEVLRAKYNMGNFVREIK